MDKYVIRNCPNLTTSYYGIGETIHNQCGLTDDDLCANCTDCVMKQIVTLCREENVEGKKLASIMRLSDKDTKEFLSRFASNKILELLDIREVE